MKQLFCLVAMLATGSLVHAQGREEYRYTQSPGKVMERHQVSTPHGTAYQVSTTKVTPTPGTRIRNAVRLLVGKEPLVVPPAAAFHRPLVGVQHPQQPQPSAGREMKLVPASPTVPLPMPRTIWSGITETVEPPLAPAVPFAVPTPAPPSSGPLPMGPAR